VPQIMRFARRIVSAALAAQQRVHALSVCPAGGVVGAQCAAEQSGISDFISLDMGGTSNDVSVVQGGRPLIASEGASGRFSRCGRQWWIATPLEPGGGEHRPWLDAAGGLRVGPH